MVHFQMYIQNCHFQPFCQWMISSAALNSKALATTGIPRIPSHSSCVLTFFLLFSFCLLRFFSMLLHSPSFALVYLLTVSELGGLFSSSFILPLWNPWFDIFPWAVPAGTAGEEGQGRPGSLPSGTAHCQVHDHTGESIPSPLISSLCKWVLETQLNRKVTSSAEHQQVRTSAAALTSLMQL